ncbi:unnamed protein product, partial [Durusdinium trenchii]
VMCNATRSGRKAKTLPASILKDRCCLLDESETPERRRVHFSAQVTVSCIEKVQELDCSTGDTRKPFGRRTLARLRSLLSIFGCLHVRLRPAILQHSVILVIKRE